MIISKIIQETLNLIGIFNYFCLYFIHSVALIRTLASSPDILLLDEPFSSLDSQIKMQVSNDIYKIIKDEKKTVIMVTHDIGEAISMSNKIILLSNRPSKIKNTYDINLKGNLPNIRRLDADFINIYNTIRDDFNE